MDRLWTLAAVGLWLVSPLCSGSAVAETDVATAIAKAATFIYSTDFIHDRVEETFSEDELRVLGENPDALNSMIRHALGMQHSVGGAMMMAYFELDQNVDYLRYRVLEPGRTYGWEGTYTNDEERFYSDRQYVFHSVYVRALEDVTGLPLQEAVELTATEQERIDELVLSPGHESQHWAIWISRKLGL